MAIVNFYLSETHPNYQTIITLIDTFGSSQLVTQLAQAIWYETRFWGAEILYNVQRYPNDLHALLHTFGCIKILRESRDGLDTRNDEHGASRRRKHTLIVCDTEFTETRNRIDENRMS